MRERERESSRGVVVNVLDCDIVVKRLRTLVAL